MELQIQTAGHRRKSEWGHSLTTQFLEDRQSFPWLPFGGGSKDVPACQEQGQETGKQAHCLESQRVNEIFSKGLESIQDQDRCALTHPGQEISPKGPPLSSAEWE